MFSIRPTVVSILCSVTGVSHFPRLLYPQTHQLQQKPPLSSYIKDFWLPLNQKAIEKLLKYKHQSCQTTTCKFKGFPACVFCFLVRVFVLFACKGVSLARDQLNDKAARLQVYVNSLYKRLVLINGVELQNSK